MNLKWWDETITLFNRYETLDENNRVQTNWKRTVLYNCFYGVSTRKYLLNTDVIESEKTVVRIPKNCNYKPYDEFINLITNDDYFTLNVGDIIIRSEITNTLKLNESGNTLLNDYEGFEVKNATINDKLSNGHYKGTD